MPTGPGHRGRLYEHVGTSCVATHAIASLNFEVVGSVTDFTEQCRLPGIVAGVRTVRVESGPGLNTVDSILNEVVVDIPPGAAPAKPHATVFRYGNELFNRSGHGYHRHWL